VAKKRAVGEGSISRRKDGRWEIAIRAATTAGTRKRIRKYAKTRAEASELLTELKRQVQHGVPVPDKAWKLGAYLDYWLESRVRPNRRPATFAQCETVVRLYLRPGLGASSLQALTVPNVQSFLSAQIVAGRSIPTVQVIRKVLSAALTNALREELITRNVARLTELPTWESREVKPWSADEATRFILSARSDSLYPAYLLLLLYGLRRGEVLGLRWCDIDFAEGMIRIRQQLQRIGTELIQGPVKTRAGRRMLPMLATIREPLLALWPAGASTDLGESLVFTTRSGRPVEPKNFVRSFQRLCIRHGLRVIRVHDVRHTTATLLKRSGVPDRDIQLILGHSRVSTTQEIYQHDDMAGRGASLGLLEAVLRVDNGSAGGRVKPRSSRHGRQKLPSTLLNNQRSTNSICGGATGTRTLDLFHAIPLEVSDTSRMTAVKRALECRGRLTLLGVVAVSTSRQNLPAPPLTQVRRLAAVRASAIHTSRRAASLRSSPVRGSA